MQGQSFNTALSLQEKQDLLKQMSEAVQLKLSSLTASGTLNLIVTKPHLDGLLVYPASRVEESLVRSVNNVGFVCQKIKYEADAKIKVLQDGNFLIIFPGEIYKVQRRENFRANLPKDWKREIFIDQVEDDQEEVRGEILDLSLGGCFFIAKNPGTIVTEDSVYGDMEILDYPKIRFKGIVRRSTLRPDGKAFGIEFTDISASATQNLNAIALKASRESKDYTE